MYFIGPTIPNGHKKKMMSKKNRQEGPIFQIDQSIQIIRFTEAHGFLLLLQQAALSELKSAEKKPGILFGSNVSFFNFFLKCTMWHRRGSLHHSIFYLLFYISTFSSLSIAEINQIFIFSIFLYIIKETGSYLYYEQRDWPQKRHYDIAFFLGTVFTSISALPKKLYWYVKTFHVSFGTVKKFKT